MTPYSTPPGAKALSCSFCGAGFLSSRKKKYCSKLCSDRKAKGVDPKSKNLKGPGVYTVRSTPEILRENRATACQGKKRCNVCMMVKPFAQFRSARNGLGGKSQWCKLCHSNIQSHKYRTDELFNVKRRLSKQMAKANDKSYIGRRMRDAIRRDGRSIKVEQLLGYSIAELIRHIERQFTKGMTWGEFKGGNIHIDHIIPQAAFDLSNEEEWKACWALTNLQPLWAADNLKKGATVERLL